MYIVHAWVQLVNRCDLFQTSPEMMHVYIYLCIHTYTHAQNTKYTYIRT